MKYAHNNAPAKEMKCTERIGEHLLGISMGILFVFVLFISLFLVYFSTRYSYYSSVDYNIPVVLVGDSSFLNIFFFLAVVLLALLFNYLLCKLGARERLAGYCILGTCCLLYVIVCLIWVDALPYYPSGDQLNATAAAHYNLSGNFSMLYDGGYLGKYPQQKGLTFFYELLFRAFGDFCYPIAARFHIGMGVLTMIMGYLFVEETSLNSICKVLFCPLFLFCTPYLILTPYAYGDLPSICFCFVLFWSILRYARTQRAFYLILSCIAASLSLMARMHTWILLIALLIGMILVAIQKKTFTPMIAGLLILASAFTAIKVLDYSYYLRSGIPTSKGAPYVLWLAMGLQDNYEGPGTFNNYQSEVLGSVDFDHKAAADIAKENLQENLEHFAKDSSYAYWFFKTKLSMQWTEPTFETLKSTHSFKEDVPLPQWIFEVYYGDLHGPLTNIANRYQSIVYLGFLFFLPVFWKNRKENAALYIPLITIVGGFLFSIIWEAQCRYVLPYYMFMLLYVPDGIRQAGEWLTRGVKHLHKHFTTQTK